MLIYRYGAKLVRNHEITAGDVVVCFFTAVMGAMSLGQAAPSLSAIAGGRGAAVNIFAVIDREPKIDSLSEEGRLYCALPCISLTPHHTRRAAS